MKDHTGWIVSLWGIVIAHIPSASDCLVYMSIIVAALQSVYLMFQLRHCKNKNKKDEC